MTKRVGQTSYPHFQICPNSSLMPRALRTKEGQPIRLDHSGLWIIFFMNIKKSHPGGMYTYWYGNLRIFAVKIFYPSQKIYAKYFYLYYIANILNTCRRDENISTQKFCKSDQTPFLLYFMHVQCTCTCI